MPPWVAYTSCTRLPQRLRGPQSQALGLAGARRSAQSAGRTAQERDHPCPCYVESCRRHGRAKSRRRAPRLCQACQRWWKPMCPGLAVCGMHVQHMHALCLRRWQVLDAGRAETCACSACTSNLATPTQACLPACLARASCCRAWASGPPGAWTRLTQEDSMQSQEDPATLRPPACPDHKAATRARRERVLPRPRPRAAPVPQPPTPHRGGPQSCMRHLSVWSTARRPRVATAGACCQSCRRRRSVRSACGVPARLRARVCNVHNVQTRPHHNVRDAHVLCVALMALICATLLPDCSAWHRPCVRMHADAASVSCIALHDDTAQ